MKNAIIIGISIVMAAVIVVMNMPRYQYCTFQDTTRDKGLEIHSNNEYIFDMVSGKFYQHTTSLYLDNNGKLCGSTIMAHPTEKKCPLLDVWKMQRQAFGEKPFTLSDWKAWQQSH